MSHELKTQRAYERDLPGGGFVAIDVTPVASIFRAPHYRGSLVVERRGARRRAGHQPPVIGHALGKSREAVVQQLLPIALFNAAIGAAIIKRGRPVTRRWPANE